MTEASIDMIYAISKKLDKLLTDLGNIKRCKPRAGYSQEDKECLTRAIWSELKTT